MLSYFTVVSFDYPVALFDRLIVLYMCCSKVRLRSDVSVDVPNAVSNDVSNAVSNDVSNDVPFRCVE